MNGWIKGFFWVCSVGVVVALSYILWKAPFRLWLEEESNRSKPPVATSQVTLYKNGTGYLPLKEWSGVSEIQTFTPGGVTQFKDQHGNLIVIQNGIVVITEPPQTEGQ